jgi:hypothetical protein
MSPRIRKPLNSTSWLMKRFHEVCAEQRYFERAATNNNSCLSEGVIGLAIVGSIAALGAMVVASLVRKSTK